jgi:GTP-binding protein HflX
MAELVYALPRLRHKYIDLSRQRGGQYGTRGSGETRFETDRRRVEQRIQRLKKEIEEVKLQRQVQRKQRERQGVPVCAIVGYTNAGKSAIFNALTGAGVLAEDKLFATLDSTCRRFRLPLGTKVLLVDTVGFIRRLPHNLIDAFRSTLEEASRADILLNVLDASDPDVGGHYETTLSVLEELDAGDIRMVTVLNKIDILETIESPEGAFAEVRERMSLEALKKLFPGSVPVSAADGRGLIELCKSIEQVLNEQTIE